MVTMSMFNNFKCSLTLNSRKKWTLNASMVKLVDTVDSKSAAWTCVSVQVRVEVLKRIFQTCLENSDKLSGMYVIFDDSAWYVKSIVQNCLEIPDKKHGRVVQSGQNSGFQTQRSVVRIHPCSQNKICVRSSIGRASVSKTEGWGFKSLRACFSNPY